jgi:hypothetical protein
MDWHVWPSASPWAVSGLARTVCAHVDYELIWASWPELFGRRAQVGAPPPEVLWEAKGALAGLGEQLVLDVQAELVGGEVALAVYGAGVVGRMSDAAWAAAAGLLTTCCACVREPLDERGAAGLLVRPARPCVAVRRRGLPVGIQPASWVVGDWLHTWWSYPLFGSVSAGCSCSAHAAALWVPDFGPVGAGG